MDGQDPTRRETVVRFASPATSQPHGETCRETMRTVLACSRDLGDAVVKTLKEAGSIRTNF
jgi:hypothetical protein